MRVFYAFHKKDVFMMGSFSDGWEKALLNDLKKENLIKLTDGFSIWYNLFNKILR